MWSLAESGRVGRTYVLSWCAWCGLATAKEGSASPEAREKDQNEAGQEGSAGRQGEEARAGFQPRFEWDDDHWDPELDLRHHLTRMRNNQEALAAALEDPSPLVRKALEQSCSYRFLP